MKKRIMTLLIVFVMMFSFVVPSLAATQDAQEEGRFIGNGGLDFYSITVNYKDEVLVDYVKKGQDFLFKTDDKDYVKSNKLVLRTGVTKDLDTYGFDKTSVAAGTNFYQLESPKEGVYADAYYSKFPYVGACITKIQDNTLLKTKSAFSFYGIIAPYDDGEPYANQNPNVQYDEDGYAIDSEVDANGKNYRIDTNGYRIDDDGLWYDVAGKRVELFYQPPTIYLTDIDSSGANFQRQLNDQLLTIPYEARFDAETGMVTNIDDLTVVYYMTKQDIKTFFSEHKDHKATDEKVLLPLKLADTPELVATVTGKKTTNKLNLLSRGEKFTYDYFFIECKPNTYRVTQESTTKVDNKVVVDESKKMKDDVYNNPDTVFTQDYIARDKIGNLILSTPTHGTPKMNVEIESISIEIDAVGDQIYTNAADDPQNKNKITISLNYSPSNIALMEQAMNDGKLSQKTFDSYDAKILATVNSKTTATVGEWNKDTVKDGSYKSTVTSIDLGLSKEELKALPLTAQIFLDFDIETHQPDSAVNQEYIDANENGTSTLYAQNAQTWVAPLNDVVDEEPASAGPFASLSVIAIVGICAGGAVLVIAIVLAIVLPIVLSKKKNQQP